MDDYSDEETDGSFDNEEDYQLSLDVQGENDFESPFSAGDEPEVSSHSTVPLDPKKCKNCYLTQKGIWSTGCPMAPRYEQGDIYLSESAKSALELFQKFFADELCGLLADQNNICHMTKTGRASDVTKEEISWDKYHHG